MVKLEGRYTHSRTRRRRCAEPEHYGARSGAGGRRERGRGRIAGGSGVGGMAGVGRRRVSPSRRVSRLTKVEKNTPIHPQAKTVRNWLAHDAGYRALVLKASPHPPLKLERH